MIFYNKKLLIKSSIYVDSFDREFLAVKSVRHTVIFAKMSELISDSNGRLNRLVDFAGAN